MPKYKTMPFEMIEVWYNNTSTPFTYQPLDDKSEKHVAIKFGEDVYLLGRLGYGLHICDDK